MNFKEKIQKKVTDVKTYCVENPKEAKEIAAGIAVLAIDSLLSFAIGKKTGIKRGYKSGYENYTRERYDWTVTTPSGNQVPAYELFNKAFESLNDK